MAEIVVGLTDLKGQIDQCTSTVNEAIKQYSDRIAERITDDGSADLRAQLVRFYKPELVRTITKNLVKDESEQRTQTNRGRQAILQKLGESPNFTLFNERILLADFIDLPDKACANKG